MSQNNGFGKRSEKGLLTPDNCVVALIDYQPQMLFGTSNFDRQTIIINTVALAMRHGITATQLRESVYTHPSSTEAFNEVLGTVVRTHEPVAAGG